MDTSKKANQLTSFTRVANQKSIEYPAIMKTLVYFMWVYCYQKDLALVTSFPVSKNPRKVDSSESNIESHQLTSL